MAIPNTKYCMDGYLQDEVKTIKKRLKTKWDCVGIIDGTEGAGKSCFAFQLCKAVDETFNLDRVCFSEKQFYNEIIKAEPGMAVCLDEAMNVFFSRASMSSTNISMVRILAECRKKNLFLLLVMPSYFEMDRYPALHRASFLVHVYAVPTGKGVMERGYFRWYDRNAKKQLYLKGKRFMVYGVAKPTFFGRFVKKFVIPEKKYETKKDEALIAKQTETVGHRERLWKEKFQRAVRGWKKDSGLSGAKFIKKTRALEIIVDKMDLVEDDI